MSASEPRAYAMNYSSQTIAALAPLIYFPGDFKPQVQVFLQDVEPGITYRVTISQAGKALAPSQFTDGQAQRYSWAVFYVDVPGAIDVSVSELVVARRF